VKRWGFLILVCLLLGVVTTVAVAWGISKWGTAAFGGVGENHLIAEEVVEVAAIDSEGPWQYFMYARLITPPSAAGLKPLELPNWSRFDEVGEANDRDRRSLITSETLALFESPIGGADLANVTFSEEVVGWPLPALWRCTVWGGLNTSYAYVLTYGHLRPFQYSSLDPWAYPPKWGVLPVRPVWSGMLIDSSIYAAMWAILYGMVVHGKRAWRLVRGKRGLCPSCGYSLTGNTSGKCPECGAATATKAASL